MKQNYLMEQVNLQEEEVYSAEDIRVKLRLGKSNVYKYLAEVNRTQQPFRVIKIGKLFRVPKQSFDDWISGKTKEVSW